ncbi:MAG: radical SAM protein [Nitrososphaeria archaeon]
MHVFRFDAEAIWGDTEVRRRLQWYRGVVTEKYPAKFRICKKIEVSIPKNSDEKTLWGLHEGAQKDFLKIYKGVLEGSIDFASLPDASPNFLDLKYLISEEMVQRCNLCERRCLVNRKSGQKGFCRVGYESKVATWFHHFGEEAPLIGKGGSGTIFFAGCNFGPCVFCQNWDISSDPENGAIVPAKVLALISERLKKDDAANINYVGGEPTPNLHTILNSIRFLRSNIALLWNSNMYCSVETMNLLVDVIDIWLPDFKYGNNECALSLSNVRDYFEIVSRNHKIAYDNGNMIIRHLVLPNHVDCCTKPVLEWVSRNIPNVLVNIMEQYHPDYLVERYPEKYKSIARRVTSDEMLEAYSYAEKLGVVYRPVS